MEPNEAATTVVGDIDMGIILVKQTINYISESGRIEMLTIVFNLKKFVIVEWYSSNRNVTMEMYFNFDLELF